MTWQERWERMDPMLVLQRKQEQAARTKQGKAEAARAGLEALFTGDSMGRKINLPEHILTAMHSWGDWAKRPQFWENLSSTPFYRLLPLPQSTRPAVDVRLDPLSHNIHRAVMRMESDITRAILYVYFVRGDAYTDQPALARHGITYTAFIEAVKVGSLAAFKAAQREMEKSQQTLVTK